MAASLPGPMPTTYNFAIKVPLEHLQKSVTVQTGCSYVMFQAQSIHLREKNIVGPTERSKKRELFSARREGPAFFDEDDVCAGF
jgi:hypothetical protein